MTDQARFSVEAGLKTAERQAEEQHQKFHSTEIDLAMQKQMVVDLQAELQKAKEEVQLAKKAAKAEKKTSYQLGVEETEIRLAEELSEVCRDYCNATLDKVLTAVGVPADSALRLPRSIYYHPQIREIPSTSFPPDPVPEPSGQPSVVPDALPPPKIPMESSQVGDQGQGAEGEKGKDKGKKPSAKAKDAAKMKETEVRNQEIDPKAKDAPCSQLSQKEDPPAKAQPLGFCLLCFCSNFKEDCFVVSFILNITSVCSMYILSYSLMRIRFYSSFVLLALVVLILL